MAETTSIQWADHSGGPYLGCSMVSPGCTNCYAMGLAETRLAPIFRRAYKAAGFTDWETRPIWGDKATRVLSKGFWQDAHRVNAKHAKAGTTGRWFPSMIDWLDTMPAGIVDQDGKRLEPPAVLADFLKLIRDTPNLCWLLLTKRPENFRDELGRAYHHCLSTRQTELANWIGQWLFGPGRITNTEPVIPPEKVWIGVSVEDQQRADERIPALLKIPARVRFLSCEPLLTPLNLAEVSRTNDAEGGANGISWIIAGNESIGKGIGRLPGDSEEGFRFAARSIMHQCKSAGVNFFMKQMPISGRTVGDMSQFPEDLRVRQFPAP